MTSLAGGGFAVTWIDSSGVGDNSGYGIKAQLFSAAGAKVGGEFLVNTTTANSQLEPTIANLANGGFVVSWTDYSGVGDTSSPGVRAQIFDANGSKVGSEFLVNTNTNSQQSQPAITTLTNGNFVVSWTDNSGVGDTSPSGVKAQIFNASGAKVGGEFLVNTNTNSQQIQPAITALTNGNFVVSWTDYSGIGDTSASGVKAQIFNASGAKVGGEFLVNTTTANYQLTPAITAVAGGGFAVTWHDSSGAGGDSGYGVRAQLFDANGNKVGSELFVNNVVASDQLEPSIAALANGNLVITWMDSSSTGIDTSGQGIKARIYSLAPTIQENGTTTIDVLANDIDVDAGATKTLLSASIADGLGSVSVVNNKIVYDRGMAFDHLAAGASQTVTISYTVQDDKGATASSTVTVTVGGVNDAPVAVADAAATTENASVGIDVLANDTDVDDNSVFTLVSVTAPAGKGSVSVSGSQLLFNPGTAFDHLAAGETETVTLTYTMRDQLGATSTATATVTVTGTNDAPVITSSTADAQGAVIEAGVLSDGTIVAGTPTTGGTLAATDPDTGSALQWSGSAAGTYGSFAINAAGAWTYTLDNSKAATQALAAGQTATDSFIATVSDGNGGSATQAVVLTVTGTNDQPVLASPLADAAAHPSDAFSYVVGTGAFTDVDNATLSYSAKLADGSALPSWLHFDAATGSFSGTPTAADMTTLQATVTATDASGASASDSFALSVTPHFNGTTGNETYTGTSAAELIIGGGGSDTLTGSGGNDTIYGAAFGELGPSPTTPSTLTATAQSYYTSSHNLIGGLGGSVGFGEGILGKNDDGSTGAINITSVFGASGLNFFGTDYTSLYVNNNGDITFGSPYGAYTPQPIAPTGLPPIIAAFWTDIDTTFTGSTLSPGGGSKGTNLVYYDLDTTNHVFTATWDDVGEYYNGSTPNAFQLQLVDRGSGDFDIIFRYETINWDHGGARAGFSSGAGVAYELAGSGTSAVLNYDTATGNTGIAGVQVFEVRNGQVSTSDNDVLDGGAGVDTLIGGSGNDVFVFRAGEANGDHVLDFNGAGTATGDSLRFVGYGAGATFTQVDATHWQVNYNGGASHDVITFDNAAPINASDFVFV